MAVGCAVIASYVGGLSDLIIDGFNGLLIKPTAEGLINAIESDAAIDIFYRYLGSEILEEILLNMHIQLLEYKNILL